MSVKVNTIYPTDSRSTEISESFCNYRRFSPIYIVGSLIYIGQLNKPLIYIVHIFYILFLLLMNVFLNKFMNIFNRL